MDKTCLKRRNRQIQDNLHLVQPIARHYAQKTGLESDDLLQVGCLGLIKAYNRYDAQRGAPFKSFAKPHIRRAILNFLRDRVGLVRLPRAVEERAMQMFVTEGMILRQTAQLIGVSAMTVQKRVKRGQNTIAKKLKAAQPDA